jgi:hypothetical protein|tara:strand:+ start:158 stop:913 length:756 start_codon:yes stop_codon:yes gene_type:complete
MAIETLQTLSYSDGSKGWPSFYTFFPDYMIGMNSYFYSFKGGNLFRHNTNSLRNNYYGIQGSSSITSVFNPKPTLDIKLFKTLSLESDDSWTVTNLNTDLNAGSMASAYFEKKEGEWFTFIRSNENTVNWNLRSANGLGSASVVAGAANATVITFTEPVGSILSIGDAIYAKTNPELVGYVTSMTATTITVDASAVGAYIPVQGDFIVSYKNSVAESHGVLGYYMEFTLTNSNTSPVELFSVGSDIMKSYP